MVLGGKVAADYREIAEGNMTRIEAGDLSLINVIRANAASNAPVQQLSREALVNAPGAHDYAAEAVAGLPQPAPFVEAAAGGALVAGADMFGGPVLSVVELETLRDGAIRRLEALHAVQMRQLELASEQHKRGHAARMEAIADDRAARFAVLDVERDEAEARRTQRRTQSRLDAEAGLQQAAVIVQSNAAVGLITVKDVAREMGRAISKQQCVAAGVRAKSAFVRAFPGRPIVAVKEDNYLVNAYPTEGRAVIQRCVLEELSRGITVGGLDRFVIRQAADEAESGTE